MVRTAVHAATKECGMTTRRGWIAATVAIGIAINAVPAFAQAQSNAAGRIKLASGQVYLVRGGTSTPAEVGQAVLESDTLRTGADGRLGVTLRDDTRVSLGPGSEVRLDSFLYTPSEGRLGLVLNFVRGIAVYVSGKIAKLAPDAIRLETPGAIVGVRGTTVAVQVVPR
jgi:hypothetical protein